MRATYSVEAILGSRSKVRVLRELAGVHVPLNAAQIAVRTKLSKPAVGTVLQELASMGLVANTSVGNARVHWLVRENVYVQELVKAAFRFESALPDMLLADLRKTFGDRAETIVLFGSYARGEQRPDSDIDVILVGADATAKAKIDELVAESYTAYHTRYGAPLSVITYTTTEAVRLWIRSPELMESLEQDGVVVSGRHPWEWRSDGEEQRDPGST